jgi:hypothetical protein
MSRATQVILARELREGRGLSQRDHVDHGVIRRHLLRRSQAEADESQQLDRGRRREQRHREHHSSGDAIDIIPTTLLEILPRHVERLYMITTVSRYSKYCIQNTAALSKLPPG